MIAALPAPSEVANEAGDVNRRAIAAEQLLFLYREMSGDATGGAGFIKFLLNWFRGGRVVVAAYRLKRFWFLLLGRRTHLVSLLWMWPIYWWCRQLGGRHEIHTPAQLDCGFRVIHCSLSCVVSPHLIAGKNLYLTGGNVIGRRRVDLQSGAIRLGDNVQLGIGSMVIGPLEIGDDVRIGAGATVVKDVPTGGRVVSSPVRLLLPKGTHN